MKKKKIEGEYFSAKEKYFIYARSAVKPQKGMYSRNNTQIQRLKGFAEHFGMEVVDVVSAYGLGIFEKKRSYMNLLKRIKKHQVQGVLCTTWHRLTRDFGLFLQLKEMFERNGIEIITLDEDEVDQKKLMYVIYMRKSTEEDI